MGVCLGRVYMFYGFFEMFVFMLVGMFVMVKMMFLDELKFMDVGIILSNMYYLWFCLGYDIVKEVGGFYQFMNWDCVILMDFGGFQVFLLSKFCNIEEEGVYFCNYLNGDKLFLFLEKVMEI